MPNSNTCYGYIAVPMTFHEAKTFCMVNNTLSTVEYRLNVMFNF